jgi:hypothetical protein
MAPVVVEAVAAEAHRPSPESGAQNPPPQNPRPMKLNSDAKRMRGRSRRAIIVVSFEPHRVPAATQT